MKKVDNWICTICLANGTRLYGKVNLYRTHGLDYAFVSIFQRWQNAFGRTRKFEMQENGKYGYTYSEVVPPKNDRGIIFSYEGELKPDGFDLLQITWEPVD